MWHCNLAILVLFLIGWKSSAKPITLPNSDNSLRIYCFDKKHCILLAYWLGMTWLSSTSLLNLLIVSYLCDTHYNSIVKKWNSMNFPWLKFGYNDILLRVPLHVKIAFLLLLFSQWRECHTGIHHIISSYVVRTRV